MVDELKSDCDTTIQQHIRNILKCYVNNKQIRCEINKDIKRNKVINTEIDR